MGFNDINLNECTLVMTMRANDDVKRGFCVCEYFGCNVMQNH